ncbi:hypothetical protein FLM48_03015 [Shewanella sp. Scap07]|uniref:patatin-like phospholipase family protein n=1 Tax=Shewanella sp. Scap07 TaxID=2589987 RepID=UPI0015BBCDEC|nr:patatin-like phospholipase family protein [Shewanella sp. Scap07]QLE84146.1 hypothetical protein FLM48_03015 [Shewanella sp. Scap07]
MTRTICACLLSLLLIACSSQPERIVAPSQPDSITHLLNDPTIRHWGDVPFTIEQHTNNEAQRQDTFDISLLVDEHNKLKDQHHLTISGGGANGAYGAGLLNGLTHSKTRPEYRLVTGISTGAIIGLYAFLGPDHDDKLTSFYTQLSDKDLYESRYIWQLFSSSSLLNTAAFEARVRSEINRPLLDKVKQQHLRGRTFLVKTTNLDEQRPVIWNMGAIAMHETAEAEQLFEDVILASASIPGIFEPVLIPTLVDGKSFDEMHVDGGVVAQVFFMPEDMDIEAFEQLENHNLSQLGHQNQPRVKNHIWLISNSRIAANWHPTKLSITDIMGRSIATMIKYQGRSNIAKIYQQSQLTNSSFNLSYMDIKVPSGPASAPFDQQYMQHIYCYGYAQGLNGQHWSNRTPDYGKLQTANGKLTTESLQVNNANISQFNWETVDIGLSAKIATCLKTLKND